MSITLECRHHPINASPRFRYDIQYRRQKLTTLIKKYMSKFDAVTVWVNSNILSEEEVKHYRCKNGEYIVIAPASQDVKFTPLAFIQFMVQPIGMTILQYGIAALTKESPPRRDGSGGTKDQYSWASGTVSKANIPMPLSFGKVPLTGNIIASYTEYDGDENEIKNVLMSHGFGNFKGPVASSMIINEQPFDSYTGVSTE